MGRLQLLLGIALAVPYLCSSAMTWDNPALPAPKTSITAKHKEELERQAELAVERAAERAAERAVEKALNSGNSSTITVTVKESYANALKTAEEQAAPGSESTRPYNKRTYDRQYEYRPVGSRGDEASAEAKQLDVSMNSSAEDQGAAEVMESTAEQAGPADSGEVGTDLSFESVKTPNDSSGEKPEPAPVHDEESDVEGNANTDKGESEAAEDSSAALDFSADFADLDFGRKSSGGSSISSSNTKTYTRSYSKPSEEDSHAVEVDDEEDAEIFRMYSDGDSGWSSAKKNGWVHHRQLWDDDRSRKSPRSFWDSEDVDVEEDRIRKTYAPVGAALTRNHQIVVPLASLPLHTKTSMAIYQLLRRNDSGAEKLTVPMKMFVSIPVPASRAIQQNAREDKPITDKPYEPILSPQQLNDEIYREQELEIKKSNATDSNNNNRYVSFSNQKATASPENKYQNTTQKSDISAAKNQPRKIFNAKYSSLHTVKKSNQ